MERTLGFDSTLHNLLFKGWNANTVSGLAWSCVAVGCLAMLLEASKMLKAWLHFRSTPPPTPQQQLATTNVRQTSSDRRSSPHRWRIHVAETCVHVFHSLAAYLLMLAVMTCNGYILIAVLLGSAVGFFFFGSGHFVLPPNSYVRSTSPPGARATSPPPRQLAAFGLPTSRALAV